MRWLIGFLGVLVLLALFIWFAGVGRETWTSRFRIGVEVETPHGLKTGSSGDIHWLLDVVAPTPAHTAAVIGNFRPVVNIDGEVRLHPIVTRLVGREVLEQLGVRS